VRAAVRSRQRCDGAEWVEHYRGQGRRGFRESTREEHRRLIRAYAHRHFPRKLKLAEVRTYALAR
jgi:hypothetical protein